MTLYTKYVLLELVFILASSSGRVTVAVGCGSPSQPHIQYSPGDIESPRYANGSYMHNQHCQWHLKALSGEVVRLEFTEFDLEPTYACSFANLTVYGYLDEKAEWYKIDHYCASQTPPVLYSSSNTGLLVELKTGNKGSGTGFQAHFKAVNIMDTACSDAQPAELTWNTGGFTSPNWTTPQSKITSCGWRITAEKDIRLEFLAFHVPPTNQENCGTNVVSVYDGYDTRLRLIGEYCGEYLPSPIGVTQIQNPRYLFVKFRADTEPVNYAGFHTRFTTFNTQELACGSSKPAEVDWSPGSVSWSPNNDLSPPCEWRFKTNIGKIVKLDIIHFDLKTCSQCGCASLSIYDGENVHSPLLGKYCGSGWNQSIFTSGPSAFLRFESYDMTDHTGFDLEFSFYDIAEHACGTHKPAELHHAPGQLTSPGFDRSFYPANSNCQWNLTTTLGQIIRLDFLEFSVEDCPGCRCSYLSIYHGNHAGDNLIDNYCGDFRHHPVISSTAALYLVFVSEKETGHKGFNIQYSHESLADDACGMKQPAHMNYHPGDILSPNYGEGYYPTNSNCEWLISAPEDKVIELEFIFFELEGGLSCEFDSLSIYDGDSTPGNILVKLCGKTLPENVHSTGHVMLLSFRSNEHLEYDGFRANYTFSSGNDSSMDELYVGVIITFISAIIIIVAAIIYYCKKKKASCCKRPIPSTSADESESVIDTTAIETNSSHTNAAATVNRTDPEYVSPPSFFGSSLYLSIPDYAPPIPDYAPPTYDDAMQENATYYDVPVRGIRPVPTSSVDSRPIPTSLSVNNRPLPTVPDAHNGSSLASIDVSDRPVPYPTSSHSVSPDISQHSIVEVAATRNDEENDIPRVPRSSGGRGDLHNVTSESQNLLSGSGDIFSVASVVSIPDSHHSVEDPSRNLAEDQDKYEELTLSTVCTENRSQHKCQQAKPLDVRDEDQSTSYGHHMQDGDVKSSSRDHVILEVSRARAGCHVSRFPNSEDLIRDDHTHRAKRRKKKREKSLREDNTANHDRKMSETEVAGACVSTGQTRATRSRHKSPKRWSNRKSKHSRYGQWQDEIQVNDEDDGKLPNTTQSQSTHRTRSIDSGEVASRKHYNESSGRTHVLSDRKEYVPDQARRTPETEAAGACVSTVQTRRPTSRHRSPKRRSRRKSKRSRSSKSHDEMTTDSRRRAAGNYAEQLGDESSSGNVILQDNGRLSDDTQSQSSHHTQNIEIRTLGNRNNYERSYALGRTHGLDPGYKTYHHHRSLADFRVALTLSSTQGHDSPDSRRRYLSTSELESMV